MSLALRKTLGVARFSMRTASFQAVPTNAGKTPPTLEQFDPLNPGEWQLGAGGKILPRLPEGTKKRVDTYANALLEGKKSEEAGPFDVAVSKIAKVLSYICFVIAIYNLVSLVVGKPLPPLSHVKAPGS
ncbi:unnamed protein product [Caenorhabditis brenneri]